MKFLYLAIAHSRKDELWEYLQNYCHPEARLILAWETSVKSHHETNGEHFHIAADMSDNTYEAFKKTIILKQYNLRGQARDGIGRQYGLISEKKVRDETKFLTYTIKNNNYFSKNIDIKTLQELYKESFIKEDKQTEEQQIMEWLVNNDMANHSEYIKTEYIEELIVMYYMKNQRRICKTRLKSLAIEYLMNHLGNRENKIKDILYYIKN